MLTPVRAAIAAATVLGASALALAAESTPTYTNVEVVSVDGPQRTIVVRNTDGRQETFALEANLAGAEQLRRGDLVILTLRGEAGRQRVAAFTKTAPAPPASTPRADAKELARRTDAPPATVDASASQETRVADAFARRLQELADQAARVDGLWASFRTSCDAVELNLGSGYEGSREWLSLWDDSVRTQVDLSSGFCRDLFNQIVTRGQTINSAMAAAQNDARRTLEPGRIRELQRLYSLEWTGWGSEPPGLREQ